MAELDIKGFVTPEQQFAGLYKLADDISAQEAAKAKANEAAKANKAALTSLAETKFNSKDYLSGTIADSNITTRLSNGLQQVYKFIAENPGATSSHIQLFASPIINQVAQDSEKSKELKRQMELGLDQIKGIKGIDANKFRESFQKRAWGIQDGKLPDNLDNVDITHNYIDDVLNNDDVYNAEAVRESIKNAKPIDYQYGESTRNKAGLQKTTLYDAKSQPFYQPVVDASGKPTGDFEPKSVPFTDGDQVVMHEWLGDTGEKTKAPIKLLDENSFEQIFSPKNNPSAAAYLRNEVKRHTEGKAPINSSQAEALSRAIAYDLVRDNMTEPASIKLKEDQKQPITKITINNAKGDETAVKDVFTPAVNLLNGGQEKKDLVFQRINEGKSDKEISNETRFSEENIARLRKNKEARYFMPLNTEKLDSDFVNAVIAKTKEGLSQEEANAISKKNTTVALNEDGNIEVYDTYKVGNLDAVGNRLATIDYKGINLKAGQPGVKEKRKVIKTKSSKDPLGLGIK
jgi:hypothetical protein